MEKIRKWMAERGIALTDTTYTDLLARRDGVRQMPRTSFRRQATSATSSRRLSAAVDVLASSQMPVGPTDVKGRGERQKGPWRNGRAAKVITAEQTAKLTREYVRYRKAYSEAIAAGALTPDRIKQIERDHERAKAKNHQRAARGGSARGALGIRHGRKRMGAGRSRDGRRNRRDGQEGRSPDGSPTSNAPRPTSK